MSPELSFIIPVKNDAARLRTCLASIHANVMGVRSEIIVADNGSTDESAEVARAGGARVLDLPNSRVAKVRNDAAGQACGEWLAFVDADNELAPGWVDAANSASRGSDVVAIGAQYDAPADGTWVQRTYDLFRDRQPGTREVGWLPSGNLLVRRVAFREAGGFDESLETCEDVDLCKRLTRAHARLLEVGAMRSIHHGDPATLRALFRGELWRGRDNLRVSLRSPVTLKSLVGAVLSPLTLLSLAAILAGAATLGLGGSVVLLAGAAWLTVLTGARAVVLTRRMSPRQRSLVGFAQAWLVAAVYESARALAPVVRGGHGLRRRA